MDNFYNSHDLSKDLLEKGTHTTGTLLVKRQHNPKEVLDIKLDIGEAFCLFSEKKVMVGKWRDKRAVLYLSTEFKNDLTATTNRRGKEMVKPLPIIKYNAYMSGIDRRDQMMAYYPAERKTLRWYKKLFIHYFLMMLLNSFNLFNKYSGTGKMILYDYRLVIIRRLLAEKTVINRQILSPRNVEHLPTKCQVGENGRVMRKKCKYCKMENNLRKDTIYNCTACPGQPGLCLTPCFKNFHK